MRLPCEALFTSTFMIPLKITTLVFFPLVVTNTEMFKVFFIHNELRKVIATNQNIHTNAWMVCLSYVYTSIPYTKNSITSLLYIIMWIFNAIREIG